MIGAFTDQVAMLFNTPVTLILVLLEIYVSVRYHKHYYTSKDTRANLFLGICYVATDTLSRAAGLLFLALFYLHGLHADHLFAGHPVLYWVTLLLLEDLSYWFMHLMDHKVRFLWAGHIHHHSSREFNFSVGLRSAVFEPIEKFLFFIPLACLGFRPLDIVLVYVFAQGWGTFVHTRTIKKLGPLEYILTTPSHHRVHHGRNVKYLDRNYGMFLIVWDKLFGTFTPEDPAEPVDYGTMKNVDYKNYADILFNEYRSIVRDARRTIPLRQKLRYIFGPPGYSHDGSTRTAKELQRDQR